MSKGLNELGLKPEPMPAQSYDDLPEFGGFTPPPNPGPYRFQLPANLSKVWDVFDVPNKGQRISAIFDKDAPLLIVQSPGGKANHDTYQTRINNNERKRGKDGPEASDLDYLLKALGEKARPKDNGAYGAALMQHGGKEFTADVRWSWFCNDKRNIWTYQAQADGTQKLIEVEGVVGCGKRYYQAEQTKDTEKQIHKQEDGTYPLHVQCTCGGVVRAFSNLDNYRA